ncbi:MAG: hypothetical protein ACK5MF_00405 [Vibrio sp.]|uniref:hypothetical protein n=1 Tax=Vibrio sp. TaxID=678 RepID=UPI003A8793BC
MAVYSISYDLNSPGQKHRGLADYLSSQGGVRVMETHWLLPSLKSANVIKTELQVLGLVDSNDVLLVSEITITNFDGVNVYENAIIKQFLTNRF